MYKVGDFVYFENSAANPYLIRRIEEIIKTDAGVNVKAQSYSRRRDIPTSLIQLADKHVRELEEELYESQWPSLDELKKHQLQHRELYMTRPSGQDLLPATQIRGKCDVILLGPTDDVDGDYLGKEHNYFYTLVYDQSQRTVVTDRGDIRSGPGYQVEIPEPLSPDQRTNKEDGRDLSELETLTFDPERLGETKAHEKSSDPEKLSENDLDRFLTVSKSVGTFARALDATASTVQPILTVSASMASRDCTTQWAMDCMHDAGYR
jgi:metastasis-associated protein MTA